MKTIKPGDPLLPRQFEVALWVARRTRNVDIASRLLISRAAINVYVSHIYKKTGTKDREELRSWFLAHYPTPQAIKAGYAEACMRSSEAMKRGDESQRRNGLNSGMYRPQIKFPLKEVRLERSLSPDLTLTEIERKVYDLLVLQGQSDKQIATKLRMSAFTVKKHLAAIRDKKGVDTRSELIVQFYKEHIPKRSALKNEVMLEECKAALTECMVTIQRYTQLLGSASANEMGTSTPA